MSPTTPSIRISHHRHNSSSHSRAPYRSYGATASPMAIAHAREPVPPPLPPPQFLPEISTGSDPGWQWGNDPTSSDFARPASVKAGSSLLGGFTRRPSEERDPDVMRRDVLDRARRGSSISTITPPGKDVEMEIDGCGPTDDDSAAACRRGSSHRLQSERRLEQTALEGSSQAYDKQLLSRIGGPSTPRRQSVSYAPSLQEPVHHSQSDGERRSSQLPLLHKSENRQNSIDSTTSSLRYSNVQPSSGAVSPGQSSFWDHHSTDGGRWSARRSSLTQDESGSRAGSYDQSMFVNDEFPLDDIQRPGLSRHERSPSGPEDYMRNLKVGTKRPASPPLRDLARDERTSNASGSTDPFSRRPIHQLPNRCSPVPRLHPNQSSLSSASSLGAPRHGSLGSSMGTTSVPSSATSYASGRMSPNTVSPAFDFDPKSGFYTARNLGPPQLSPLNHHHHHHHTQNQCTLPESTQSGAPQVSPDGSAHSRQGSMSQAHGGFICECCPKKPKKFDTEEELRVHESEKQYGCHYCSNRFKNKNEAERHQNSLHLRRHSWSCAALTRPDAAFHSSPNAFNFDVCGFCGEKFSNPPNWDDRSDHLNRVHKFGECNQGKKFFRADHFRQHLKHSHAGTSGKWTNMLENACMKDEPPPEKQSGPGAVSPLQAVGNNSTPPSLMITTTGLSEPGAKQSFVNEERGGGT